MSDSDSIDDIAKYGDRITVKDDGSVVINIDKVNNNLIKDHLKNYVQYEGMYYVIKIGENIFKIKKYKKMKKKLCKYLTIKCVDDVKELRKGFGFKFGNYVKRYMSPKLDQDCKYKLITEFIKIFITDYVNNEFNYGLIYCVENIENGKKYVGQCKCKYDVVKNRVYNMIDRWNLHITKALGGLKGGSTALHKNICKFGVGFFKIYELERCYKLDDLTNNELKWINKLNTVYPNGYNLFTTTHNTISRKRISESNKGHASYIRINKVKYNGQTLPPRVELFEDNKGNIGFRATCEDGNKAFLSRTLSMDKKLELAIAYSQGKLKVGKHIKSSVVRKNEQSFGLPKYMRYYKSSTSEGYRVAFGPLKKGKTFTSKKQTMEEKKQAALEFIKQCNNEYEQQTGNILIQ